MAATGSTRGQVDSLLVAERAPRGFDEPLSAEQGGSATLGELVSDPAAQDDFLHVVDRIEVEELHKLTGLLGERERGIVSAHYGLGCPAQTLREIAGRLGVSVERVRQLEERALARLRDAFEHPEAEPERAPELRELPPGDHPHELCQHLGRALATEHVAEAEAMDMLIAAHEVAACVWGGWRPSGDGADRSGRRQARVRDLRPRLWLQAEAQIGAVDRAQAQYADRRGHLPCRSHGQALDLATRHGSLSIQRTWPLGLAAYLQPQRPETLKEGTHGSASSPY